MNEILNKIVNEIGHDIQDCAMLTADAETVIAENPIRTEHALREYFRQSCSFKPFGEKKRYAVMG